MPKQYANKIDDWQHQFSEVVSDFLLRNHYKGNTLIGFIRRYIKKWRLGNVNPFDILLDAVGRGLEYIRKNEKPIETPEAWLRVTCLNILRDRVKQTIHEEKLFQDMGVIGSISFSQTPLDSSEFFEKLEVLQQALERLPESDRSLIKQRFYQGKTYKQVRETLKRESEEEKIIPLATLRKRESRALQKLKKIFMKMYQGDVDTVQ